MPITKQSAAINFMRGVDLKTDPFQVDPGRFLSLKNMVFSTGKKLTKRNGFGSLASLPYSARYLTTVRGDLTAVGERIQAYSSEFKNWRNIAGFYPCNLSTLSVVRSNTNQSQVDSAVAPNGLLCMVWTDQDPTSLTTNQFKYAVYDSVTGQQLLAPVVLTTANATKGFPRVFVLGNYFIVAFTATISATDHLQFIAISSTSLVAQAAVDITTSITTGAKVAWDAAVLNNTLYFAWNGAASSGLKMASVNSHLAVSSTINPDATHTSTSVSVCADAVAGVVYATYYSSSTTNGYTVAINSSLQLLANFPTQSIATTAVNNLTSCVAVTGTLSVFLEITHAYSYDSGIPSNFVTLVTVNQSTGVASGQTVVVRSVGLGSKAFVFNSVPYFLGAYTSPYQPSYFLINGNNGNVVAELAYSNGGGYVINTPPSVSVNGDSISVAYLIKDFIQAVSSANADRTSVVGGIYSQTGISQATFILGTSPVITSAEIGSNLNLSAGFLWGYDGTQATEQGFLLYPDSVVGSSFSTGGHLSDQNYYYCAIYSWTDARGNIFRSAPSLPILGFAAGSMTNTGRTVVTGPNLRLTYKANVKIEIYRWSTAQPVFYQVTSIAQPLLNSTSSDSWSFNDTLADASIVGNEILYTTGGVIEDIGGPAFASVFTFDDRLWGIDSEDRNLLWYSKQVISGTPVELSDLLTLFVAPSIGAQGSTGDLACGYQMDDKLILFKPTGAYYINGTGPDNTGSQNNYSQPTFITAMVGCSNQASIVLTPEGLMFEFSSEAGNQIWLLGRDLSTRYIGADVQSQTLGATVTSAVTIPGTNQVRFSLSSGQTLVYDYFYGQWCQFTVNALASILFEGLQTFINSSGKVFQETPGLYLDGSTPVVMSFITSWLNLAGLQGYVRAYWFYILGQYMTPHKISLGIAYDYNPSPTQLLTIQPNNFSPAYGADSPYGSGSPYGGPGQLEQWKIFLTQQRCQAFQIQYQEIYDPKFGIPAGAGVELSGINLIFGQKKGYVPLPFNQGAS